MTLTRTGLSDLDRHLARGPRLVEGAVLGAGVGALLGWLSGRRISTSAAQGAAGGVCLGLFAHGYEQWRPPSLTMAFEVVSVNSSILARVPGPADFEAIEATISPQMTRLVARRTA